VANFGGVRGEDNVFVTGALTRFIELAPVDIGLDLLDLLEPIFAPCCWLFSLVLVLLLLLALSD
jgi:hypothetical protein